MALWNLSARLTESVHRKGRIVIRLDSSAAWALATRLVSANRDVLSAISWGFVLLPTLACAGRLREPRMPWCPNRRFPQASPRAR